MRSQHCDSSLVEVRLEHRGIIRGLDGAADMGREKPGRRWEMGDRGDKQPCAELMGGGSVVAFPTSLVSILIWQRSWIRISEL